MAFKVLKRLVPNPLEIATSIMNVKSTMYILNLTFHIHDVDRAQLISSVGRLAMN